MAGVGAITEPGRLDGSGGFEGLGLGGVGLRVLGLISRGQGNPSASMPGAVCFTGLVKGFLYLRVLEWFYKGS